MSCPLIHALPHHRTEPRRAKKRTNLLIPIHPLENNIGLTLILLSLLRKHIHRKAADLPLLIVIVLPGGKSTRFTKNITVIAVNFPKLLLGIDIKNQHTAPIQQPSGGTKGVQQFVLSHNMIDHIQRSRNGIKIVFTRHHRQGCHPPFNGQFPALFFSASNHIGVGIHAAYLRPRTGKGQSQPPRAATQIQNLPVSHAKPLQNTPIPPHDLFVVIHFKKPVVYTG